MLDAPYQHDGRSQRTRMLAGDAYLADDAELLAERLRCAGLLRRYNALAADQFDLRRTLLTALLGACGEGAEIVAPLFCDYGYNLHLGPRSFANVGLVALDVARITVGADVLIGPNVQLLTPTHPVEPEPRRAKWEAARPITLEDNVWLGGGVIVCPGVTVGANTVVGAGSVVVKDLPPNVVAAGNPARVIRPVTGKRERSGFGESPL